MAAPVWPIGTFLDTLKTNLAARMTSDSITNVEIYTAPVDAEEVDDDREVVVLGISVETDEEVAALKSQDGHRNEESNVIECQIMSWDIAADGQSGEVAAVAARNRSLEIFGVVEREIRKNMRQGTNWVRNTVISSKSLNQGSYPNTDGRARACIIEFDITLTVRTNVAP